MTKVLKILTQLVCFWFPWKLRSFVLRSILGFEIGTHSRIGLSLIISDEVQIGENVKIGSFNYFGAMSRLTMCDFSRIGNLNVFGGIGKSGTVHFLEEDNRLPGLSLGPGAAITNRHYFDCCNLVEVGKFSIVAGIRSQIFSHSIDLSEGKQKSSRVSIGDFCFIGTGAIILPGVKISDNIVVAAGSVVVSDLSDSFSVFGGVPARKIKDISKTARFFGRDIAFVR